MFDSGELMKLLAKEMLMLFCGGAILGASIALLLWWVVSHVQFV